MPASPSQHGRHDHHRRLGSTSRLHDLRLTAEDQRQFDALAGGPAVVANLRRLCGTLRVWTSPPTQRHTGFHESVRRRCGWAVPNEPRLGARDIGHLAHVEAKRVVLACCHIRRKLTNYQLPGQSVDLVGRRNRPECAGRFCFASSGAPFTAWRRLAQPTSCSRPRGTSRSSGPESCNPFGRTHVPQA